MATQRPLSDTPHDRPMPRTALLTRTPPGGAGVDLDALLNGYRRSRVLFAALELELFEYTCAPRSGAEIEHRLGLHRRATRPFLDALVGLELLDRQDGPRDVYHNTATTNRHLVSSSAWYLGADLLAGGRRSYRHWNWLTEALRSGEPQNELADGIDGTQRSDPQGCRRAVTFERFAELIDLGTRWWSVVATDADLAVPLARAHPNSIGQVLTTRAAAPGVRGQLVLAGLDDRVAVAECDVFIDTIAPSEVYLVDSLRDYTPTERERLLERVRCALARDGVLVVVDDVIDDERRLNPPALLSSLDALIEGSACLGYTASEFDAWCRVAGFAGTEIAPIAGAASAAIAYTNQGDIS